MTPNDPIPLDEKRKANGQGRPPLRGIPKKPILVLSNRLPFTLHKTSSGYDLKRSQGGLINAVIPVLERCSGTWVGWPGVPVDNNEPIKQGDYPFEVIPIGLTDHEVSRYYHGLSNRTLWPLFHSLPEHTVFERRDWEAYEKVNDRFAQMALAHSKGKQVIWIHDYHLLRTPLFIRRSQPKARLAFFLHIPFPSYDIFRILPWARKILRGLLSCDLIGFHVDTYKDNFLNCVEALLGARVDRKKSLIEHGDRTVHVGAFPLGIDFKYFEDCAQAASETKPKNTEKVILGVDRLDYTKGIPERILAFQRFLELYPEQREKVTFVQLAVPSRSQVSEYRDLKRHIDELVGRINGRYGSDSWTPIRYMYRSVSQQKLASMYRNADVALVTPLRDGMNLVAKEYVACQVDQPGVLILSRLAGAAETMHEALLVNPYNIDGTAHDLNRALTMDEAERRSRLVALRLRERTHNVFIWGEDFLKAGLSAKFGIEPPREEDFDHWLGDFVGKRKIALFLDYDGTLADITTHPTKATLSTQMRSALQDNLKHANIDLTIVSGRAYKDISKMVGFKDICYAANHGLEIEGPQIGTFRHEDLIHFQSKTHELAQNLGIIAIDGGWIEEKGPTLTFHYRKADKKKQARMREKAHQIITKAGFQARDAHCAVEARPPIGWDKGHAVLHVLRSRYGPDWSETVRVIYAGDDNTDEDAFRVLLGLGVTFRIGPAETSTLASRRLPNVEAVYNLLKWLAQRAEHSGQDLPKPRRLSK